MAFTISFFDVNGLPFSAAALKINAHVDNFADAPPGSLQPTAEETRPTY